ncbi:MAG: hypothetical protein GQF41_0361 [Candidatus Rifleibacterium amylolyticum]|nr:MAG: hypothetical protein GQF41_0361 [Candidatus Rifleibacterium amylolyticum]
MKRRHGLTLLETCLTMTLASILLTTLFFLTNNHRNMLRRLDNNTSALYMLESMRNFAKFQLENGVPLASVTSRDLLEFVECSHEWRVLVKVTSEAGVDKLVISLARIDGKTPDCVYTTEVTSR